MRIQNLSIISAVGAALLTATSAQAGTEPFFTPLTASAVVTDANSTEEQTAPWILPADIVQTNLTSLKEVEADATQSISRVAGLGRGQSMFDMSDFDPTGNFVFIPHETRVGAGVTRYDIKNDRADLLFRGDLGGAKETPDWSNDYAAFDPCTYTPNDTLFLGEEWSGEGRIMEVLNPFADPKDIKVRELESIPNVAHEGLRFGADGRTIYFVDEWNSGSLYKFVSTVEGDYTRGQSFVLKVDAFDGVASDLWNDESNKDKTRVGKARWVPITSRHGKPNKTKVSPFRNGPTNDPRTNDDTRGGRVAADEVGGTPYGRPEDMEVGTLANGNEVVYFTATSEKTVYSVEMRGRKGAIVRVFANEADTPKNLGFPATTAVLNSPDNLAQDGFGNIYIIEDAPNGSDIGGDIWFVRDTNNDGVAESIDHFMSNRVRGSESTGMIFNPNKPYEFIMSIQHPSSTELDKVPGGMGDAVWKFDISALVKPPCKSGAVAAPGSYEGETCEEADNFCDDWWFWGWNWGWGNHGGGNGNGNGWGWGGIVGWLGSIFGF